MDFKNTVVTQHPLQTYARYARIIFLHEFCLLKVEDRICVARYVGQAMSNQM